MSRRPRLVDLFCCAGGAAMGYHRAGFDVIGVDIIDQPRYPFPFFQADALTFPLDGFDAIHASPPCQAYSVATIGARNAGTATFPDLLAPTRERLQAAGVPWIIENVPGAPMRPDVKLCGCMFDLPMLRRERWFETSWAAFVMRPPCYHPAPSLTVTGNGVGSGGGQRQRVMKYLGRSIVEDDSRRAMGIDWMRRGELSQAIPPAYTEYLGGLLLAEVERTRTATAATANEGER